MCLGVPGRLIEITNDDLGVAMGRVSFAGITKEVCLAYVPEAVVGDYVLVHVGFALSRIDEDEARRTLALLADEGALEELEAGEGRRA
jgi:hydrogenase expression/formation protein HypC